MSVTFKTFKCITKGKRCIVFYITAAKLKMRGLVYRYGYGLIFSGTDDALREFPYTVYILEDTTALRRQVAAFRSALWLNLGGAGVVLLLIGLYYRARSQAAALRWAATLVLGAVTLQVLIGAGVVWFGLPLTLATAHNAVAALLLLTMINLNHAASFTANRHPA